MINMVDYEMVGRVDYFTVHPILDILFADANGSGGIEGICTLDSIPLVLIQSLEILGIDDGIFALSKRYPAEPIAVAAPAVK